MFFFPLKEKSLSVQKNIYASLIICEILIIYSRIYKAAQNRIFPYPPSNKFKYSILVDLSRGQKYFKPYKINALL